RRALLVRGTCGDAAAGIGNVIGEEEAKATVKPPVGKSDFGNRAGKMSHIVAAERAAGSAEETGIFRLHGQKQARRFHAAASENEGPGAHEAVSAVASSDLQCGEPLIRPEPHTRGGSSEIGSDQPGPGYRIPVSDQKTWRVGIAHQPVDD